MKESGKQLGTAQLKRTKLIWATAAVLKPPKVQKKQKVES
jgi:hypothetical protein